MLTQATLKEFLNYDPNTGIFVWLKSRGKATVGSRAGGSDHKGHRRITLFKKSYWEHRLAWLYVTGCFPVSCMDHINGNGEDNRFCNLRLATHAQNMQNMKIPKTNTSGHVGVYFENYTKKWRAMIEINGKKISIGRFCDKQEAVFAREKAKMAHHTFNPVQRIN